MDASGPLVLIVDDDASVRGLLDSALALEGFRTVTADNALSALRSAANEPPDVVLLDVMMPGRDGFSVLAALRARPDLAHVPVVMVTARVSAHDIRRATDEGADYYITKPFAIDHLVWQVQEAVAAGHRRRSVPALSPSPAAAHRSPPSRR